jgi:hypothetical protein
MNTRHLGIERQQMTVRLTRRDLLKRVTGSLFTQVLPFYDPGVVDLYGQFEQGLYRGLQRA